MTKVVVDEIIEQLERSALPEMADLVEMRNKIDELIQRRHERLLKETEIRWWSQCDGTEHGVAVVSQTEGGKPIKCDNGDGGHGNKTIVMMDFPETIEFDPTPMEDEPGTNRVKITVRGSWEQLGFMEALQFILYAMKTNQADASEPSIEP
jgi:hypothetical protein